MIQHDNKDIKEVISDITIESQKKQLEIREKEEVLEMRRKWANFFKGIVLVILFFEIIITFLVGSNLMVFEDEWFLRIIITGGFAQIMVMPFTLTKFLFNVENKDTK
ncbi:hypothetical protein JXA34_02785 [Patescibacteria group bacterium]|nr:hypothetical protein [Patescibacteria group bacterium]